MRVANVHVVKEKGTVNDFVKRVREKPSITEGIKKGRDRAS
jgi:hypothetical protein